MVVVLLIWIYIIAVCAVIGMAVITAAGKLIGYRAGGIMPYLLAGLAAVTVYSEAWSLFGGVGKAADAVLTGICIIIILTMRHKASEIVKEIRTSFSAGRFTAAGAAAAAAVMLIMAYGTSHGIMHYDTSLYHAQSIHWIESYGVVPGLGNLHCRLGYNSAAFALTALFSFAWAGGQSYHVTAGFCALLLAWECLGVKKKLSVSLFARFTAVYYLFMIFDEMVSPASDYYMVCLAFILVIRWLDHAEEGDEEPAGYAMLAIFSCLILTVKLSGALLILCALSPAAAFVRKKQWGSIFACIGTGTVVILPYLIRNVIISGWLLYPSTSIDLFDPDWKIPEGAALSDYMEIQVYGRGMTDVAAYSESPAQWMGSWFSGQSITDRLFIAAAIVAAAVYVVKCIYYGVSLFRGRKTVKPNKIFFVEGIVIICFLFWLFTSPLMRYGCLFVYLTAALVWGEVICGFAKNRRICAVVFCLTGLVLVYKTVMLAGEVVKEYRSDTWITQQDYDSYEVETYRVDGVEIYIPTEGDQTGYYAFPSSPWEMDIELRGSDITDGFRQKQ